MPEFFLIYQHPTLSKWLKINLAKNNNICANNSIEDFEYFFLKIFKITLPEVYYKIIKSSSTFFWNILNIPNNQLFTEIFNKNNSELKKYQIAKKLSNIFKKNLMQCNNWKKFWKINCHNIYEKKILIWKKSIWNIVTKKIKKKNVFTILKKKIKILHIKKMLFIPNRIFIYNSHTLPIFYWKILKIFSSYCQIFVFNINNNNNYFYNLNDNKNIFPMKEQHNFHKHKFLKIKNNKNLFYSYQNNISIYYKKKCYIHQYTENNVLNFLKNYISLKNVSHIIKKHKKFCLLKDDKSIDIQVCSNIQQEIEILVKTIINQINNNKNISPKNILILAPNIEIYIPYIHSIFQSFPKSDTLPFTIFKKNQYYNNNVIQFFETILCLYKQRFEVDKIFDLLRFPFIHQNFALKKEELHIAYTCLNQANIKWGINNAHLKHLNMSSCDIENTWEYGIKRILLGTSMYIEDGIWNDILPINTFNNVNINKIISIVMSFIILLDTWRKKFRSKKLLKNWKKIGFLIVQNFFDVNNKKIIDTLNFIKKKWMDIISEGIENKYLKKISIKILIEEFKNFFKKNNCFNLFLESIIFSDFDCFENIPFKIIGILGLNKNFPKTIMKNNLDLTHIDSYPLNNQLFSKEICIFLNIILSTHKKLYLSYVDNNIQKNNIINSSIFIKKIINYLLITIKIKQKNDHNIFFKKNKIITYLCTFNYHTKFLIIHPKTKKLLKSIEKISKKITKISKKNNNFVTKNKNINTKILINFWKDPIKFHYINKMKINISSYNNIETISSEPFLINNLYQYKIKKKIFNYLILKKNTQELFLYYKKSGILPQGQLGQILFKEQLKITQILFQNFFNINTKLIKKEYDFKIHQFKIYGTYTIGTKVGIFQWKPSIIRMSDQISLWIHHLIYCYLGGKNNSFILGIQNTFCGFYKIKKVQAQKYLINYIQGYHDGMEKPIYFTQSGCIWILSCYDKKEKKIIKKNIYLGYKKFIQKWNGNIFSKGEKNFFYIKKIINKLNITKEKKIYTETKKWLLPILKYKIWKNPFN
ncbi:exodeoxyribonuclease V subunit gamma [Buchnera aphidicola]|uniref:exodeoxyribonuclease V subunit gamma n=1 Tax=Buchnera aphidicola TaxID=9 RepID=UPI0021C6172E